MESNNNIKKLLLVSFFTLFLFNSARAVCVPRTHSSPSPSPSPVSAPKAAPEANTVPSPTPMPAPKTAPSPADNKTPAPAPTPAAPTTDDTPSPTTTLTPSSIGSATTQAFMPIIPKLPIDPAVKKVCDYTDHSELCLSSVLPILNGKTEPTAMLEAAMKANGEAIKSSLAFLAGKAKEPGITAAIASRLEDCRETYTDALDNLQAAADAMVANDIGTLTTMLSAVITDFTTCDDGFDTGPSPMSGQSRLLINMTSNCLAIAELLPK